MVSLRVKFGFAATAMFAPLALASSALADPPAVVEPTDPTAATTQPTAVPAVSPAPATPPNDSAGQTPQTRDVRTEIPILAYTYTAFGASAKSVGAQAYGLGLGGAGQKGILGGGITVWGSPIDRLTIIGDGQRNVFGNFSPSIALVVRLLGKAGDGWSLGALGKFKVDGFASGPTKDEVESEIELGMLLSYARTGGMHFDLNAVAGRGNGDEGEVDSEGRLRIGHDIGRFVRVGVDGQARVRLAGPKYLPNGRIWDFAAGPQVLVGSKNFFGSVTAGPATMGLLGENIGWTAIVSVGGTTL